MEICKYCLKYLILVKDAELQNMIAEQKLRTQRILGEMLKNEDLN